MTPAFQIKSEGVVAATGDPVVASRSDITPLIDMAVRSSKKRARICLHASADDSLHEMLIVLLGSTYLRPHRHRGKSESFHIIEGELDVILFDDEGEIDRVIPMGAYGTGKPCVYRLASSRFHIPIISGDYVILHETTNGPLNPADTEYAPWAADEDSPEQARDYLDGLRTRLKLWQEGQS